MDIRQFISITNKCHVLIKIHDSLCLNILGNYFYIKTFRKAHINVTRVSTMMKGLGR